MPYPNPRVHGAVETALEPGMALCVEALVSPDGGDVSIKLEEVLITEDGCETLTRSPWETGCRA